jgi:hypothetical protein
VTTDRATPDDGRPSDEARARLTAELSEHLAASRVAWDAALLRSDAALDAGDDAGAQAALDDHRVLLGSLEERLGAIVADAIAAREAEAGVGDGVDVGRPAAASPAPAPVPPTPAASPPARPGRHGPATGGVTPLRRGASALLGAAAAVALLAGLLSVELPLDGAVTASGVAGEPTDVGAEPASAPVAEFGRVSGFAVFGPRATLPRFSGSLPRPAPPAADAEPTQPAEVLADAPAPDAPDAPEPTEPAVASRSLGDEVDDRAGDADASPLEDLVGRLPAPGEDGGDETEDGDGGLDVATSVPAPFVELTQRLRDAHAALPDEDGSAGPASDRTLGLR